jgi:heavy metal translocating P-type ATPase
VVTLKAEEFQIQSVFQGTCGFPDGSLGVKSLSCTFLSDLKWRYTSPELRKRRGTMSNSNQANSDSKKLPRMSGNSVPSDQGDNEKDHDDGNGLNWRDVNRVVFVSAAAGSLWLLGRSSNPYITAIGVACTLVGGFPIFHEAYENITQRRMTMELSMAIAIVAALTIREIFTALIITLFVLVAEILEGLTVGRGRRAIQRLIDLLPSSASVRWQGQWKDVPIFKIAVGDEVLARPGARIPVDGKVIGGHSFVDQAPITGESMPVEKGLGAVVHAGTINQSGALEIRVERLGRDTTFGKIIEAVERAEKSRAPIQGIADRLSGYLVYFALAAAAATFLITHNTRSTISVVIVAGACGIAAGTPLAILGAIGRAAQDGAIIKGGLYLERLSEVDTFLLDKTGTLTYGTPEVTEIRPANGASETFLLESATIAECQSEHPVAKAIMSKAIQMGIRVRQPDKFAYTPGRGIVAEIEGEEITVGNWMHLRDERIQGADAIHGTSDGAVLVTRAGHLLGSIHVADLLRPDAQSAIQSLKSMGLKTILLTGDSKVVAQAVGKGLGVDEISAELLPEQKLQRVEDLLAQGNKVVMVGDGVNDAPALAAATVGVAMGSGTDVARECSHIVLIGSDLAKLAETVRLARRCQRTIMQNFVGTLVVDSIGVGLAAFGFLNPLLAAFIHVSSEMTFILNSARLLPPVSSAKILVRGAFSDSITAAN